MNRQVVERGEHLYGAPLVVIGAPLVIDNHEFRPSTGADQLKETLTTFVKRVKNG
ncbi:hypothetical protein [Bacillus nitroreducens]